MSTETPITLQTIHEQLLTVIERLNALTTPRPAAASAPSYASTAPQGADAEIPQPSVLLDDPGLVQVHFGKNNGVALAKLSERSLSWYATEQPPRCDSSGKPYPPRPQEMTLRNAARQLWHTQRGTLGASPKPQPTAAQMANQSSASADEEVPF